MASIEDVERLVTALPGVAERTSYGNRAWFVEKALFCWVRPFSRADLKRFGDAPVPQGPIIGLRTEDEDEKASVLDEGAAGFFTIEHLDGFPGYLVQLDVVDDARLALGVEDAWLARAPRALAERFLAERS